MKILYVCHRIPYPPNKGEKIRAYYQIRHLAKNHDVHLFALADRRDDLRHVEHLKTLCPEVEVVYQNPRWSRILSLRNLFLGRPLTTAYFHSGALRSKVARAARKNPFDVCVAYSSGMIPYVEHLGCRWVIDFVDLDSQKWLQYASSMQGPMRWIYAREGRLLFDYELDSAERADASILVTEEEGKLLAQRGNPNRLSGVPLGVDLDFYDVEGPKEEAYPDRPILIFVGNMDYRPNFEAVLRFADSIFPRIAEHVPDALFLVVGANPTPQVQALDNGQSIRVTGRVPDTRTYLRAATVSVVPLSMARGIQTKVLEAMAMELPVVLTEQAALGIGAQPGRDYEVAADDGAMADQVLALLHNRDRRKELGKSARKFVRDSFAWADKLGRYEEILCRSAASDRKPTAFK